MKSRTFDADDIQGIVRHVGLNRLMDDAIEALDTGCRDFDPRSTSTPARDGFEYSDPDVGLIEWMPTMKLGVDVVIKMVGYHPSNPSSRDIPTILSTALSFDTHTGQLLALLDATFITALRTGAASALASRILAAPDSGTLGLIGAGAQSVSQLHALSRVFDLERVIVHDKDQSATDSFPVRASQLGLEDLEILIRSPDELIASSDIICTATSVDIGEGPVFMDKGLKPSVHINAVGSDFTGKTEIPHALLQRSLVCPDFLPQALKEGECQQLHRDQIGPDLVELVKKQIKYREYQKTSTVFDSTGWAFEDYLMVGLLVGYGQELGYGKEIELTRLHSDPRNPYGFLNLDDDVLSGSSPGVSRAYALKK